MLCYVYLQCGNDAGSHLILAVHYYVNIAFCKYAMAMLAWALFLFAVIVIAS